MPRKGKRLTIERAIYRDGPDGPYEVRVMIGGFEYRDRMPADATLPELRSKRAALESVGHTDTPRAAHGTVAKGVPSYLRLKAHLATVDDLADDLRAWCQRVGHLQRHRLTARDVLAARAAWLADGLSPKTINDRVGTLRNYLRVLDGKQTMTLFDEIDPLPVVRTPIRRVSTQTILDVDHNLQMHEQDGKHSVLKNQKTRARFRVLVSTGRRPIEIMRAEPGDVDLSARVWVPRDAKGGYTPGLYLNDDALAAWQLFVQADAWGPFNLGSFVRTLRSAGWPADLKVYQARHTIGMSLSEAGVDLDDVGPLLGHKAGSRMTRQHYVPVLNSRIQRAAEAINGRFLGWIVGPTLPPDRKRKKG